MFFPGQAQTLYNLKEEKKKNLRCSQIRKVDYLYTSHMQIQQPKHFAEKNMELE